MRAFVTGSTGLLGSNLVRELIAQGHDVKALARTEAKYKKMLGDISPQKAQVVVGDMDNVEKWQDSLKNVDVVFHTAAYFREYHGGDKDWPMLEKINVHGTMNLAKAAQRAGVKRFIDTSSSGTIGIKADGSPGDESTPPAPIAATNLYFKSKVVLDAQIRPFARESGLSYVSILPGWMHGPQDAGPTAAGQLALDFLAGKLTAVIHGGTNVVDARDVARGMILAAEKGRDGEKYLLSGRPTTLKQIAEVFASLTGAKVPPTAPYPVAFTIAALSEAWNALRGTEGVMTRNGLRIMHAELYTTSQKAERELGVTFRPLHETLRDEILWYQKNGYTKHVQPLQIPVAVR